MKNRDKLKQQIDELRKQLDIDSSIDSYIEKYSNLISKQWILDNYEEYEKLIAQLPNEYKKDFNFKQIDQKLEEERKLVEEIERSNKALKCPYCEHAVRLMEGTLHPYDGKIVAGDVKEINKRIEILVKASKIKLPEKPEGLVKINLNEIRKKIEIGNKIKLLEKQLLELENEIAKDPIPSDVTYIEYKEGVEQIDKMKRYIVTRNEIKELEGALSKMKKPEIPKSVQSVDVNKAGRELETLKTIKFIEEPKVSSVAIKASIDYYEAKEQLPNECDKVTNENIVEYASGLTILNTSRTNLEENTTKREKIKTTKLGLMSISKKVKDTKTKLEESNKHKIMLKDHVKLKESEDVLEKKKEYLANLQESKEIAEKAAKICIEDIIGLVESNVNNFLYNLGTDIFVKIASGDKVKIKCYKGDGLDYGKPSELSKGEQSYVSFAFNIAFGLISDNDILILDEVTDKLSVDNKDKCIELLLEIMSENKKTLIITDHHCHSGDYDHIIDLGSD